MERRLMALILALVMMLSCWSTALAADKDSGSESAKVVNTVSGGVTADVPKGDTIVVALKSGQSKARYNYNKLSTALRKANKSSITTIKVKSSGTYYVTSGGGSALMLRSNTTLDLNGAELVRWGGMNNLIQNCTMSGSRSGRGYSMTKNITIKNGTLNGKGGRSVPINLVNIGHAANVTFSNLKLYNCRGGHLIELCGCKNAVVEKCTFSGYKKNGGEPGEALQLDIAYGSWNGVYVGDGTPCKNILVQGCTFKNYPSGVGNHHTLKGHHNSNIKIINNVFTCAKSSLPAIWSFCFENSEISGNTFLGKYAYGVRVSGGNVKVNNNSFGTSKKKISYQAVYVVTAGSNVAGRSSRVKETVKGGTVNNNVIYSTRKGCAIEVGSKSKLSSVSNNTLVSSKGSLLKTASKVKISKKTNNKKTTSLAK